MKSQSALILSLLIWLIPTAGQSQTNTFPSSGNVGIGTVSPQYKIDVVGELRATGTIYSNANGTKYFQGGNDAAFHDIDIANTVGIFGVQDPAVGAIKLGSNGGTLYGTGGNIGIGTNNPINKLQLAGGNLHMDGNTIFLRANPADQFDLIHWNATTDRVEMGGWSGVTLGYTAGSEPSVKPVLTVSQDKIGIGFSNPSTKLDIALNNGRIQVAETQSALVSGNDNGGAIYFGLDVASGRNTPTAAIETSWGGGTGTPQLGIGVIRDLDRCSAMVFDYGRNINFYTNNISRIRIDGSGNVAIGTTNATHKLTVNGTIRAKEVIVDTGWSDYVFAPDYRLAPLNEVEQHIKENKHLPGIPSAKEVSERGISIGDMQARLLAKIEELTLHLIAQQRESEAARILIDKQAARIERLEAVLTNQDITSSSKPAP